MKTFVVCRRTIILATGLALVALAVPARAASLSFTLNAQPGVGRIAYAGGDSPLQGGGLQVLTVQGIDVPNRRNELIAIENGSLDFVTGKNSNPTTSATPASTATAPQWTFGPGGAVTITGGVPALGIPDGTLLLTGDFKGGSFAETLGQGALKASGSAFFNVVAPKLAEYFGLPAGAPYSGGLTTMFASSATAPGAFSSNGYTSGSVTTSPVPEPGTLAVVALMMGAGLAWRYRGAA